NTAVATVNNKAAFTTALASATTPSTVNTLINTSAYNIVTYLVDYPSPNNSVFTKIQGFFTNNMPNVTGTELTALQTLLKNTNLAKFLNDSQKNTTTTLLTNTNVVVDLNTALNSIGTNYTNENLGTVTDVWPTQKTIFAIVKNSSFDASFQGANGGDLIYAKLVGFYDNRAVIGMTKLSDGFSGLFDVAQSKPFLTDKQKQGISDRNAIIGLEIGLTAAFNTLNSSTDKLAAIKTFIDSYATDTRNLRAKRSNLKY
ncbi:MAG: hypothetical protein WC192_05600, partial [Candidatus Babeliales bacterium]